MSEGQQQTDSANSERKEQPGSHHPSVCRSRATGNDGGSFLIAGPAWRGESLEFFTIEDLLTSTRVQRPPSSATFKRLDN
jgi:hypothetical protein